MIFMNKEFMNATINVVNKNHDLFLKIPSAPSINPNLIIHSVYQLTLEKILDKLHQIW